MTGPSFVSERFRRSTAIHKSDELQLATYTLDGQLSRTLDHCSWVLTRICACNTPMPLRLSVQTRMAPDQYSTAYVCSPGAEKEVMDGRYVYCHLQNRSTN